MKILIRTTEYSVIVDLNKTNLEEYITCLYEQYPITGFEIIKWKWEL